MQILQSFFGMLLSVATVTYAPAANADYVTQAEFGANGKVVGALEANVDNYLYAGATSGVPLEIQQIGNSVYNVGQNYGAAGQAMTSSTPQMDFVTKHISGYCSPNISVEKQHFSCTGQTGNFDSSVAQFLEMGDIRTSVLLEPTIYPQDGSGLSVLDLAAQNLIRNITMPFPSTMYVNYISNPRTFANNTTQRKAYANYMANQALIGVARYALNEMYGMRVSGTTMGVTGGTPNPSSQSIMNVMENEASRRFLNTDNAYTNFLTAGSTDQMALLRELAAMQAFELWMNYQNYRQNERIAALLSAILASNVNAVITQNNAAAASGLAQ